MLVAKKQKDRKKKKKKKRESKNGFKQDNKDTKMKLNILLYSMAIVLICIYLLSRYSHTTEIQMKLSDKKKEINTLTEKKHLLRLELEEIKDSGYIEKQAKIRMNMRRANEDQLIFIEVK